MKIEKVWLIRTLNNQVLGPVSKKKIVDLLNKKMLSDQDELCSGNGFWFFLRESEMVERYIYQEEIQPFDLISDVKSVLGDISPIAEHIKSNSSRVEDVTSIVSLNQLKSITELGEEVDVGGGVNPEGDDLEFPDVDLDVATPDDNDLEYPSVEVESTESDIVTPSSDDLEFPDIIDKRSVGPNSNIDQAERDTACSSNSDFSFELESGPTDDMDSTINSDFEINANSEFAYPKSDDLEFPDIAGDLNPVLEDRPSKVMVQKEKKKSSSIEVVASEEDSSEGVIPDSADLEFPEI